MKIEGGFRHQALLKATINSTDHHSKNNSRPLLKNMDPQNANKKQHIDSQ